ncbi:MAG TPA: TonB family protein [Gemmatimonadaceae bacterium]|nr:TonB family protein [Gemmatimonadaceae bacterium]
MKTSLISAAIHVSIVGLYMMVRPTRTEARPTPEQPTMVLYHPRSSPQDPITTHLRRPIGTLPGTIVPVPTTVPPTIPPIDAHIRGLPTFTEDTTWTTGPSETHAGGRGSAGQTPGGVLSADVVDVQVTPYANAPTPRYPESLRGAGVEGEVTLEFVVDTSGRVERGSVRTISSTAEAFVVSVSDALAATRYHPALVGGCHVRQLVRQQFVFSLRQR